MQRIAFNFEQRIDDRLNFCIEKMAKFPSKSFPQIFSNSAELEGFYRAINNDRVCVNDLNSALCEDTLSRIPASLAELIVIHDTTKVSPKSGCDEFGPLTSADNRGFFSHVSLITDLSKVPIVYGSADIFFWIRPDKTEEKIGKESQRWFKQVESVEKRIQGRNLIHVMDREGDFYELFAQLVTNKHRFVIRLAHDRVIKSGEEKTAHLFDYLEDSKIVASRTVKLSERKASGLPAMDKAHPPRNSRDTVLEISAKTVEFQISGWVKHHNKNNNFPKTLQLNVVCVKEKTPVEGEKPIQWLLVTLEPIDSTENILKVVDIYRRRWIIEEFFVSLKIFMG